MNAEITIAYKCNICGNFEFFNRSLFELIYAKSKHTLGCRCKNSFMKIEMKETGHLKIDIPCIGCGKFHAYFINKHDIFKKDLIAFVCRETYLKQGFLGKDDSVRNKIDNFEGELDEIIDMFGYERYFKNTHVMFDTINTIHNIAELGKLFCECGSSDIDLNLGTDKIMLKCRNCKGNKTIRASSNNDLKNIHSMKHIEIPKTLSV